MASNPRRITCICMRSINRNCLSPYLQLPHLNAFFTHFLCPSVPVDILTNRYRHGDPNGVSPAVTRLACRRALVTSLIAIGLLCTVYLLVGVEFGAERYAVRKSAE